MPVPPPARVLSLRQPSRVRMLLPVLPMHRWTRRPPLRVQPLPLPSQPRMPRMLPPVPPVPPVTPMGASHRWLRRLPMAPTPPSILVPV
ncbi:hypothetical protein [Nocardia sp. XZ_19_369]|uniref:hypothetical protein n=1 Tax=Nocardia sp. XZ_19_369 TaxID=2769487 RepID=UPI00189087E0|nr:hypothetical protein [Nocardia sp. XZ_19_369]